VNTKFRKQITTALLPINKQMEQEVLAWVEFLIKTLKFEPTHPLFPATNVKQNKERFEFEVVGLSTRTWSTAASVRQVFKHAFERVGLPYFPPHTFRHMVAKWGTENLSQQEMKALSQNLGHDHIMTT
jgi:integrase